MVKMIPMTSIGYSIKQFTNTVVNVVTICLVDSLYGLGDLTVQTDPLPSNLGVDIP
jgi:hypothetical protein